MMRSWVASAVLLASLLALLASCHTQHVIQHSTAPAAKPSAPAPTPSVQHPTKPKVFGYSELAQAVTKPRYRIALFVPLDLGQVADSGFSVTSSLPLAYGSRAALEAYEGCLMALDSLARKGMKLELRVVDTRSADGLEAALSQNAALDSSDLWLGMLDAESLNVLAQHARSRRINLISFSYPNDAGVTQNPFVFICNSTLQAHCSAIERFASAKYHPSHILLLRGPSAAESQVQSYLESAIHSDPNPGRPRLLVHTWSNDSRPADLVPYLKPDEANVIVLGSLYPQASLNILGQLDSLSAKYPLNVIGMPTLDGLTALKTHPYFGMNILYSSPYRYQADTANPALRRVMWAYFRRYQSRPSDAALKAYESTLMFAGLLQQYGRYFNQAVTNSIQQGIVNRYRFTPIYLDSDTSHTAIPDYVENTHLYFYQIRDGVLTPAN